MFRSKAVHRLATGDRGICDSSSHAAHTTHPASRMHTQTKGPIAQAYNAQHVCKHAWLLLSQPGSAAFDASASTNAALTDLEEGLQLSKVEVGVEAGGLVPDGALLGGLDLVPVQLLQLAPLACCRPHLHSDTDIVVFLQLVTCR